MEFLCLEGQKRLGQTKPIRNEDSSMQQGWKKSVVAFARNWAMRNSTLVRTDRARSSGGQCGILSVPTKFLKSWIQLHYLDRIHAIFSVELPEITEIDISVRSSVRGPARAPASAGPQLAKEAAADPRGFAPNKERPTLRADRSTRPTSTVWSDLRWTDA